MTTISGLDLAGMTGVGWIPLGTPPSKWRAISIEAEGSFAEERAVDLTRGLRSEYDRSGWPDFVAIEAPLRVLLKFKGKVNSSALELNTLAGAVTSMLDAANVPWGMVPVGTWHKAAYGEGVRPKDGETWKDMAILFAERSKIMLPDTKRAARDAAESIGIARAWAKCDVPRWHREAFQALLQRRQPVGPAMPARVNGRLL